MDSFVVASHDVKLFQLTSEDQFQIRDIFAPQQDALRCVEWGSNSQDPNILGIGLESGSLVIIRFSQENRVLHEFKPHSSRPVQCVSFNPKDSSRVAVGRFFFGNSRRHYLIVSTTKALIE